MSTDRKDILFKFLVIVSPIAISPNDQKLKKYDVNLFVVMDHK